MQAPIHTRASTHPAAQGASCRYCKIADCPRVYHSDALRIVPPQAHHVSRFTSPVSRGVVTEPGLFSASAEPLAARMRPKNLEGFLGQPHLLGPGNALGA